VIPTASSGLGVETTNLNLLLIATREQGDVCFDLNAGFNWEPEAGESAGDAAFAGVAARWNTSERWMLFAETFAWVPAHRKDHSQVIVRYGWQVEMSSGVFPGGAIATGSENGGDDHTGTSLGLTIVF
jgi:hypothetical protein